MENILRHNQIKSAFHQFMSIRMDEIGSSHLASLGEYQSLMKDVHNFSNTFLIKFLLK
ncbi:hypothetical protein PO903_15475 [Paenibacillus sp. PK4536]|uniref:hypothetical protein n=1 Tax=Paenibacillus sp. PK4536 TaxID=3024576 RepID=UPI002358E45B|nr:hypothetical protein [Paenibacillus sp. PK4536]WIM38046.1 hypothetical protein PO903_15475 [Paenibacillus sp. PK4536]